MVYVWRKKTSTTTTVVDINLAVVVQLHLRFLWFLANVHVRYMLSPFRLSVVCLSVTFLHPTQPVEIFGK